MQEDEDYYMDSTVHPGQHFRLRLGAAVVGYMIIRGEELSYSADNSAWSNSAIEHDHKDRSAEIYDADRQMIFEQDLVKLRRDPSMDYTKIGLIVWHTTYRGLVVKLLEEDGIIVLDVPSPKAPYRDDLKVISHLSS
jgi:hypothetical protein